MAKITRLNDWLSRAMPTHWKIACLLVGMVIAIY